MWRLEERLLRRWNVSYAIITHINRPNKCICSSVGCQVFHYCVDGVKHSWQCPENTVFHQIHLNCVPNTQDVSTSSITLIANMLVITNIKTFQTDSTILHMYFADLPWIFQVPRRQWLLAQGNYCYCKNIDTNQVYSGIERARPKQHHSILSAILSRRIWFQWWWHCHTNFPSSGCCRTSEGSRARPRIGWLWRRATTTQSTKAIVHCSNPICAASTTGKPTIVQTCQSSGSCYLCPTATANQASSDLHHWSILSTIIHWIL